MLAKALHDHTIETILVICYTNHALDQFLEDLLDIGIKAESMVRLGSKSSARTLPLMLKEQKTDFRMSFSKHCIIQEHKKSAESYHQLLTKKVASFARFKVDRQALMDYLEFSEDSDFFDAFTVPDQEDGMQIATKKGKKITKYYLLDLWLAGNAPGVFRQQATELYPNVWTMDKERRKSFVDKWNRELIKEKLSEISTLIRKYDRCQEQLRQLFNEKNAHIIQSKRIIGCTTTAAAMYVEEIRNASPGIILVEEAGEILESHILTAMTEKTKQLILIGDHKQLRPKVNNYALTVEKGDGYNLNQSMFERLVLAGVRHTTLKQQHRMRPEISALVRHLTYPELEDALKTQNRPPLRGFQDNIMFICHDRPELNANKIADRRDENSKASKENEYEADMVLKCVRYLGQQGYNTEELVVLTPYLGQLFLLKNKLQKDNDPILNDLDSWDLIRAGLLTPAAASVTKRPIKLSTIGMYELKLLFMLSWFRN